VPQDQNQLGGKDHKSPENVINNNEVELNETKKEKLSSSDNIKEIENELKHNLEKSGTDLIHKLDKDRGEKELIKSDSETSSDYVGVDNEQIAVYSNAHSSNKTPSNVFLDKKQFKTKAKYENIQI
jgi:hypothetical protein